MAAIELMTEWFGARVGKSKGVAIRLYCAAVGLRPADFVRTAMDEYMANHPAPEQPNE